MAALGRARNMDMIKGWPETERPRERLLTDGAQSLSDGELLAITIRLGCAGVSAVGLARQLLLDHSGLDGLRRCSAAELSASRGIGPTKAAQILAALELGRRSCASVPSGNVLLRTAEDVFAHLGPSARLLRHEVFWVLLLDPKHGLLHTRKVAQGDVGEGTVHPRQVFVPAMREFAHSVILVHNHPSGDPRPSLADRLLTRRLVQAGRVVGVPVLDHVIVGFDDYFSFSEAGELE